MQAWSLRPTTLLKETLALVFFCKFSKIFKNTYFVEHLRATATPNSVKFSWPLTFPSAIRRNKLF